MHHDSNLSKLKLTIQYLLTPRRCLSTRGISRSPEGHALVEKEMMKAVQSLGIRLRQRKISISEVARNRYLIKH